MKFLQLEGGSKMIDGYKEAEVIDRQLNAIVMRHKITIENAREFLNFTRAIITTLYTIQSEAHKVMREKVETRDDKET